MKKAFSLLCVDLPDGWTEPVQAALKPASSDWYIASTTREVEIILAEKQVDAVVAPIVSLGFPSLGIIGWIHSINPKLPVIIISDQTGEELSDQAMELGAKDFMVLQNLEPCTRDHRPTSRPNPANHYPETNDHQTRELFNSLVSLNPSVLFSCSPEGRFPYRNVSGNLESLTGYALTTFMTDENFWYEHIHPDDLDFVEQTTSKILSQPAISFDYRFRHKDGQFIWLHDEWRAILSDSGEITEIIGSTIDINRLKITQEKLQERLKFEELIINLITRFINAPHEQIDDAIFHILSALCDYIGSASTFFFLVNDDASALIDTYEWHRDEVGKVQHRFKGLPLLAFPWSIGQLKSGHHFLIDRISELPEKAQPERDRWLSQGLQAMLAIPVYAHQQFIGFLGASHKTSDHQWESLDLTPFNLVSDAFASVWSRIQTENQLRESEERFRLLAENSNDVIALHQLYSNRILYISPSCLQLTGYRPEELIGHQPKEFVPQEEWIDIKASFARMMKMNLESSVFEYHFQQKTQKSKWVETTIQTIRNPEGETFQYVSVTRDITQRKQVEEELLSTQQQMQQQVLELARRADVLATLSDMGNMLQVCSQVDEACNVITKYASILFPGTSGYIATLVAKSSDLEVRQRWGEPSIISRRFRLNECWGIRRSHPTLKARPEVGANCAHFEGKMPACYLCIPITTHSRTVALLHIQGSEPGSLSDDQLQLAETTAEQIGLGLTNLELRQSLTDRTRRDPLTGVLSRSFLEETLEVEFARACTDIKPLSFILIDIDHFREVNAAVGHFQADQFLINLANMIQSILTKEDIIGRFGGDEFLILLPETQLEAAYQQAEKLRVRVHNTFSLNGNASSRQMTISAGVACWPTHGENPTSLIRAVTLALEEAKKVRDQVALANLPNRLANFKELSTDLET